MSSEKQGQKNEVLRRHLELQWREYERLLARAPKPTPENTVLVAAHAEEKRELQREIGRQCLYIYLNEGY